MSRKTTSRRRFLQLAATSTLAAGAVPAALGWPAHPIPYRPASRRVAPSDRLVIATIGMGGMGFGDTDTALGVDGVEFVAAADAYDGRLARVKEVYGKDVYTTRDYRELLDRDDIDAVIIATPDHLHAKLAVEALQAGKHVYLEKPMVQDLEDGWAVINAQKESGKVVQVGSQFVSSMLYLKARDLLQSGVVGMLNMVQATYMRNSAIGAWQYTIPPDASPETVAWDRFLGDAPQRPFDATRFFRWRNYWDYGTGVSGDLFVHLFSGLHVITHSIGPRQVLASGGLRYWKDGRDVPDVMTAVCEYPETETHPEFTVSLQVNFADGGGGGEAGLRFIGNEGVINVGWNDVTVTRLPQERAPGYTVGTFPEAMQEEILEDYRARHPRPNPPEFDHSSSEVYEVPAGYHDRLDHFNNFFNGIRTGEPVVEGPEFGFRAAAPALMANVSYRENRILHWDPKMMKVVT